MRTPRRAGVAAAAVAFAALTSGAAGVADAAPVAPAVPTNVCPSPGAHLPGYAAGSRCVITLSVTVAVDGQAFTYKAYYFVPFEKGTIFLHSTGVRVGTFRADAQGIATGTVTLPPKFPLGRHSLELRGDEGTDLAAPFTVVGAGGTTTGTRTGTATGTGGALPFTGADVAGLAGGGVALIVGGALLTVVFRRRRAAPAA